MKTNVHLYIRVLVWEREVFLTTAVHKAETTFYSYIQYGFPQKSCRLSDNVAKIW